MKVIKIFLTIAMSFLILGCSGKSDSNQKVDSKPEVPKSTVGWNSDGVITEGEYTTKQTIGEIEVLARVDGDFVMMALKANTTAWISIGIDPEDKMKGADILMFSVKDGKTEFADMYSTGPFGPHPADEKQGGISDVTMVSGTQQGGITIVEFKRKLNTGDSKDKPLKIGENKVMWGIGDNTNFAAKHARRGYGTLILK